MIPLLGPSDLFPPVERALAEPNGLLAAGGGLSPARLIEAYRRGIFPWYSAGDPVLWWCPDPRTVLRTDAMRISKSLRRRLRRADYEVSADRTFDHVLDGCAAPRRDADGTWLLPPMRRAYQRLHALSIAHSVEVRTRGELVAGVYGVALGRMFFGESMFTRVSDGSKIALAALTAQLARWHFPLVDCQMRTEHLVSLGATEMPRREFVVAVEQLVALPPIPSPWHIDAEVLDALRR